jgi:hypothetical protein
LVDAAPASTNEAPEIDGILCGYRNSEPWNGRLSTPEFDGRFLFEPELPADTL